LQAKARRSLKLNNAMSAGFADNAPTSKKSRTTKTRKSAKSSKVKTKKRRKSRKGDVEGTKSTKKRSNSCTIHKRDRDGEGDRRGAKLKTRHFSRRAIDVLDEVSDEDADYRRVLSDEQTFRRFIDSKHFYFHLRYNKFAPKSDAEAVAVATVRKRSTERPPPSLGSFFSSTSRLRRNKRRAVPRPPMTYSVTLCRRPLGFFIETRRLKTLGEFEGSSSDTVNGRASKVNAYVSRIHSADLDGKLVEGSQLLRVNGKDITGLSFARIFERLSEEPLPFELKLAAPTSATKFEEAEGEMDEEEDEESDGEGVGDDDDDPLLDFAVRGPRVRRVQTIDETKLQKQTEKKKRLKFRFRLF